LVALANILMSNCLVHPNFPKQLAS